MSGGDNISNIKNLTKIEYRYIDGLTKIRCELNDILDQPLRFSEANIRGLIVYIGDVLNE